MKKTHSLKGCYGYKVVNPIAYDPAEFSKGIIDTFMEQAATSMCRAIDSDIMQAVAGGSTLGRIRRVFASRARPSNPRLLKSSAPRPFDEPESRKVLKSQICREPGAK